MPMSPADIEKLQPGVYRLYWDNWGGEKKDFDFSLASVGIDRAGKTWFAAANWVDPWDYDWSRVHSVHLIEKS